MEGKHEKQSNENKLEAAPPCQAWRSSDERKNQRHSISQGWAFDTTLQFKLSWLGNCSNPYGILLYPMLLPGSLIKTLRSNYLGATEAIRYGCQGAVILGSDEKIPDNREYYQKDDSDTCEKEKST